MSIEPCNEPDAPVASKDLSELRPAAAAEAPTRAGGGAGLQRLARRAPAGPGAAAPRRREPADGGSAPPGLSAALARAERRGVERAAGEVAQQ